MSVLDPACTGYIDLDGYLAHDGATCPVHEPGLDIGDGDAGDGDLENGPHAGDAEADYWAYEESQGRVEAGTSAFYAHEGAVRGGDDDQG